MRAPETEQEIEAVAPRIFATTQWSVVRAAGTGRSEEAQDALAQLCRDYWHPIFVYVRRRGYGPDEAQDLTQEFFAQLIEKNHLRLADHRKGRFRSFLLATLHYFLAREWSRAHRQKRGGEYRFVSLDQPWSEDGPAFEPADCDTPEKRFQQQWALTVLKQTMNALHSECAAAGKAGLFNAVKHVLSGERDGATYSSIAALLSMTESSLRVAVHRLRHRYGELLRAEIGRTVDSPEEVDGELRYLIQVLSA